VKKVLYISYDGMTDPLGQSQVIPYLVGLANRGYKITILSAEKPNRYINGRSYINHLLSKHGIAWEPVMYTKRPPILSTLVDIFKLRSRVKKLMKLQHFQIVHCRSYIAPLAGLMVKRKQRAKFVFDMRGFWADERVDGGLWNLANPIYRAVYNYFKKKEKQYLEVADHVVSLTQAAKNEMQGWRKIKLNPDKISVIPCCADFDFFNIPSSDKRKQMRVKLGYLDMELVFCYLGSLGTWYMVQEMFDFFIVISEIYPEARFLIISGDSFNKPKLVCDLDTNKVKLLSAKRDEVVDLLAAVDIGLSFIKPVYSKISSSPTKQGEMLAMGIPMIVNSGVGDVDAIVEITQSGIVLPENTKEAYQIAAMQIVTLVRKNKQEIRDKAIKILDLKVGVEVYNTIYGNMTGEKEKE